LQLLLSKTPLERVSCLKQQIEVHFAFCWLSPGSFVAKLFLEMKQTPQSLKNFLLRHTPTYWRP